MKKIYCVLLVFLIAISAIAQTGGGFNLEQNVIGNGGWRSDGGGFTVLGTMGQSNAGSTAAGGEFHLIDGLWAIENPTVNSPFVHICGRVTRPSGVGISEVFVTINYPTTNLHYQAHTGAQGYYCLAHIPTGANYVITVRHRHFRFNPDSISVFVSQDRSDVDFVSEN